MRLIPEMLPTLAQLGHPEVLRQLACKRRGLVIICGPTGCGKSTTLAAMVHQINCERCCHVITLEEPIEYLHTHRRSIVNQREIPQDTPSFSQGLRAALREDPDVILVGEMRDAETMQTVLTAADIREANAATLVDLLRNLNGISFRSSSGNAVYWAGLLFSLYWIFLPVGA